MSDSRPSSVPAAASEPELEDPGADRYIGVPDDRSLREHTAHGVIVNAGFNILIAVMATVRRLSVAFFLTAEDYGLWGIILLAVSTLVFLKDVGIGDKYVQQGELDQELAFQKAFTLEVVVTLVFTALLLAALPLFALIYDDWSIVVPGAVLSLTLPLGLLNFPAIIFYRRMQYMRQRSLEALNATVALTATIGLAAAGLSYWSLIIGHAAGIAVSGIATMALKPYRLRLRYDRGTLTEYFHFSWPLMVHRGTGLASVQANMVTAKSSTGLGGIGAIGLAGNFGLLADAVDAIVTRTMYPAMCAVADRIDTLHEAFVKSNRLALMWGLPFGLGLSLFSYDIVDFGLGNEWEGVGVVLVGTGIAVAITQIGFNWTAFMRARNDTRGVGVVAVGGLIASLALTVPALLIWGLAGFAWASVGRATVMLLLRGHYLRRMFAGFGLTRHIVRAALPVLPAVGLVLLARVLETDERTSGMAMAELGGYVLVTLVATWLLERELLREMVGYLRRARGGGAPLPT